MSGLDPARSRPGAALPQPAGRVAMQPAGGSAPSNLADILERVLDKGIVIAGDIQINLLEIELLTIKLRLLVASVDRAREMGINWWESDPSLSRSAEDLEKENRQLRERLERLERAIGVGDGESSDEKEGNGGR
ncbi:MAG TPA: gas vesicle protein [Solirubrobacteraceae bacterium]|nr:gas vesicle protein [Solirubrobacteraceae bacterium]